MDLNGPSSGFVSPNNGRFKQTFRSLKIRNFRIYSIGQLISLTGTWMQITALPWLVYTMTESASALGMVSFAGSLPLLLLTYFGGTLADKFDRKKVLILMQTLAMLQAIVLFLIAFNGVTNLYLLVAIAFFGGCVTALDLPTRQAFVTDLVDKENLTNAIALNSAIWNSSRMVGPAIAGFLIGVFSESVCFGINAVSFLASLATLISLKVEPKKQEDDEKSKASESQQDVSIAKILLNPAIATVLFLSMITSIFGFQHGILMPVIVDKILNGSAEVLGFMSAAAGLGALIGSLSLAGLKTNKNLRNKIGIACLILSVAIFTISLSTSMVMSIIAVMLAGASVSTQLSGGMSIVQRSVDESVRGRVMGVYSTCMVGFAPFAAMLAGWLGSTIGVSATLLIAGSAVCVSSLLYLLVVRLKGLSKPEHESSDEKPD